MKPVSDDMVMKHKLHDIPFLSKTRFLSRIIGKKGPHFKLLDGIMKDK